MSRRPSKGNQVRSGKSPGQMLRYKAPATGRAEEALWVHRKVDVAAEAGLLAVASLINPRQAAPKQSNYSITVVHPNEIKDALKHSTPKGKSLFVIAAEIRRILPATLFDSTETDNIGGLRQEKGAIALGVTYPQLAEERFEITSGISRILELEEYEWPKFSPHITLARGQLSRLTNRDQIDEALPNSIGLQAGGIGPLQQA